ncbi:potassium transporter TrkG [Rhabdobacter roseus]|uniref:Potassium uptake TrkH family protein n=1 Tax=Rhabdobacter roseus TaxID=1655419 RepID=A0A840TQE7_9BACT|nr:potassium transporter TrkG [Rhabdobacter roseus]MBB5283772.1 potassium uptake TrkH family protein [Rhabdobacter roseus]
MNSRRIYWNFQNVKNRLVRNFHTFFEGLTFYTGLFVFLIVMYDLGFPHIIKYLFFASCYLFYLVSFTITVTLRTVRFPPPERNQRLFQWFLITLLAVFCYYKYSVMRYSPDFNSVSYYGSLFLCFVLIVLDSSRKILTVYTRQFNPALAFVLSFMLLALVGCGLLLLPRSTINGISFTDALFTSVSAVCVTGLATLDTASEFTRLGKFFIMLLIQLGGLGVLSFTSFFGYLYKGGLSLENQLFLKDFVTAERVSDTFKSLMQIILITLGVELLGAIFIYYTVDLGTFANAGQRFRFSVFHAVSAFCNAGFSTMPDGLFNSHLTHDYDFQLVICVLAIVGGIGFPIIADFSHSLKHYGAELYQRLRFGKPIRFLSRTVSINTSLVLTMTGILLASGMVVFFITEYYGVLYDHETWDGKLTTAFFASMTPRTAGFNTFDLSLMQPATVLVYLLFMWIGASPGSTGGGIKTTTFAVAMLNIISLAQGQDRVEFRRRQIPAESIRRAFSTMILSLLVIGPAILIITVLEPGAKLIHVAFECFSAFSTTGLSLGITPQLSDAAKIVLVFIMFIGRVGTFTLFVAFIRRVRATNYKYPKENIFIN